MPTSTPDALWSSPAIGALHPVAVEVNDVTRIVAGKPLLDGVQLAVAPGVRVLLAGTEPEAPSLLLRIMAGLARLDRGTVSMAGMDRATAIPEGWARRFGYVGSDPGIPLWMTPAESLDLAARLAGIDGAERHRRVEESLQHYQLGAIRDRPLRRAGRITLERTALAAALLPDPEVLLLDEPLRAHTPSERVRLLHIPGERRTVLTASRFPAQQAGVVDHVVLIRNGKVALDVPISELDARKLTLSLRGLTALADLIALADLPS